MKRYFTLMLLSICLMAANAQQNYKVGTDREKRGLLLEEFTGAYCPNCPDGHRIAKSMGKGYGDQIELVSIHTGNFSPNKGSFILRTEDGDEIAQYFKVQGFPTGMISRHSFTNKYVHNREGWIRVAEDIFEEDAAVNLYLEATYDDATRQLDIHTEGYSPVDNSAKDLRLNVIITQDYIKGYQKGSAEGDNYIHMHALRDCITPATGDAITNKAEGEYFTADYQYALPQEITGQTVKAENIRVIAFVTEDGMNEVTSVKGTKPVYKNMNIVPDAEIISPDIEIGETYGYQFFEANVRNISAERLTSATFDVTVNDEMKEVTADCDIAPFETGYVKIPCSYSFKGTSASYKITLKRINDNVIGEKSLSGSFKRPASVDNEVIINFKTDKRASENEFLLKDQDGNIVITFGPYENGKGHTFNEKIKLEKASTYCMEITDRFGNGLNDGRRGSLITCTASNDLIDYFDEIPDNGVRSFFCAENDLAIDGIIVENGEEGTTYSLSGMVLDGNDKGERIIIRNGKKYLNR